MKISHMRILDKDGDVIQDVGFFLSGINVVFGDIVKPDNDTDTSNSIGKTLFLYMINVIFGCNRNSEFEKNEVHGFSVVADVLHRSETFHVEIVLGSDFYLVGDSKYSLSGYKALFEINRSLLTQQVFLEKKTDLIKSNSSKKTTQSEYASVLKLLGLDESSEITKEISDLKKEQKSLQDAQKRILSLIGIVDAKRSKIRTLTFMESKEYEEHSIKMKLLEERINQLDVGEFAQGYISEYSSNNQILKSRQLDRMKQIEERNRYEKFLSIQSNAPDSKAILKIYEGASVEVPELIKKHISDVESFHRNVIVNRKELYEKQLHTIKQELVEIDAEISKLREIMDKTALIISENRIFHENMKIYSDMQEKTKEFESRLSRLNAVKELEEKIEALKEKATLLGIELKSKISEAESKINSLRDYVFKVVRRLYEKVDAHFDITTGSGRSKAISIDLNLTGDTGEGVGSVGPLIIDLLLFKVNTYYEVLIHDSSCFSGIDPRQVSSLIEIIHDEAMKIDKQYIISINKYQLNPNNQDAQDLVEKKTILTLDEDSKLLKFDY